MRDYETHITVNAGLIDAGIFQKYCVNEMAAKAILIKLGGGDHPLQLMLAKKASFLSDQVAALWAEATATAVEKDGWKVLRVKLEAPLHKQAGDTVAYYEAHWKVDRDTSKIFPDFLHSRNLYTNGSYYLSRRWMTDNVAAAREYFDLGHALLECNGFSPKHHYERVVLDTNQDLDKGWVIPMTATRSYPPTWRPEIIVNLANFILDTGKK